MLFSKDNLVVVLPYKDATQSGVIPMAFYYGVPLIATDVGGIKEQLFGGDVGVLCNSCDAMSLADAMEKYLTDHEFYTLQVERMYEYSKQLTWDGISLALKEQLLKNIENNH